MRMRTTIGLSLSLVLVATTAAIARQTQSADQQPAHSVKSKPNKSSTGASRSAARRNQLAARASRGGGESTQYAAALPPADQYVGPMQAAGPRVVGAAAWYGNHHVGQRMANGEPLDTVRATAAHRSLPMHSLARVTNLNNGRSVIVKITDRGPVSPRLQIDLSPRAADEIDMKRSGIVTVSIEPVAPATQQAGNPAPAAAASPAAYPAPAAAASPAAYPAPAAAASPAAYPAPAAAANPAAYPAPAAAASPAAYPAPAAAASPAAYPAPAAAPSPAVYSAAYPAPNLAVSQAASVAHQ